MTKKICVLTGSRAEFGLFKPILRCIQQASDFDLQIIATAMHLSKEFGETYTEIESDGFIIARKIPILSEVDDKLGMIDAMSKGLIAFAKAFDAMKPDYVLLLGDRFETFVAAQAAYCLGHRIGHIHGGEVSFGALDENFRHATTKLSHDHFPSHALYRDRIVHMGEFPNSVFVCGAPGIDNLKDFKQESLNAFQKRIGMDLLDKPLFLVTYHPETVEKNINCNPNSPKERIQSLFEALDHFPDARVLITKANADPGGRFINTMIDSYVTSHKNRVIAHTSLGQEGYYQALSYANLVIGNSSSALIEAAYFPVPVINIGGRQEGRVRHKAVIDSDYDTIHSAMNKALDKTWQATHVRQEFPFGIPGEIAQNIFEIIKKRIGLSPLKRFYDYGNPSSVNKQ